MKKQMSRDENEVILNEGQSGTEFIEGGPPRAALKCELLSLINIALSKRVGMSVLLTKTPACNTRAALRKDGVDGENSTHFASLDQNEIF